MDDTFLPTNYFDFYFSARGLGSIKLGRPFGTRGIARSTSRGIGRGSRGGRRGRPPFAHTLAHSGLSLVTSPTQSLDGELRSSYLQSPVDSPTTPPVLRPDILPPQGMAEFLRQTSVSSSTSSTDTGVAGENLMICLIFNFIFSLNVYEVLIVCDIGPIVDDRLN